MPRPPSLPHHWYPSLPPAARVCCAHPSTPQPAGAPSLQVPCCPPTLGAPRGPPLTALAPAAQPPLLLRSRQVRPYQVLLLLLLEPHPTHSPTARAPIDMGMQEILQPVRASILDPHHRKCMLFRGPFHRSRTNMILRHTLSGNILKSVYNALRLIRMDILNIPAVHYPESIHTLAKLFFEFIFYRQILYWGNRREIVKGDEQRSLKENKGVHTPTLPSGRAVTPCSREPNRYLERVDKLEQQACLSIITLVVKSHCSLISKCVIPANFYHSNKLISIRQQSDTTISKSRLANAGQDCCSLLMVFVL